MPGILGQVDDRSSESFTYPALRRPNPQIDFFADLAMLQFFMAIAIHDRLPHERPQRYAEKRRHICARLNPSLRLMLDRISLIEYRISNIEYRISNIEYRISNIITSFFTSFFDPGARASRASAQRLPRYARQALRRTL
ncbi:MAG TPA: hypothetical protein VFY40_05155 [Blastocatellia bacterium]|nr:hypothetical protein [Blastocatellia bacterium]